MATVDDRRRVWPEMSAALKPGRFDHAMRRKAIRKQRESGCSVYLPAEVLALTGFDPKGPVPFYRCWGASRGRIVVQLYREQ